MPLSVLLVSGVDSKDLLQRLSTNDVKKRAPGELFLNVFTSDKGRVLEICSMVARENDVLLFGMAPGAALLRFIKKSIFREKVTIEDLSSQHWLVSVLDGDAPLDALWSGRGKVVGVEAFHALVKKDVRPAGEPLADFEAYRIERGVPWLGKDVSDENNPHEAGLGEAISWDKGCYVGQEVVARLDTYDKVQRHLRKLSGAVVAGAKLTLNGEEVGVVTSAAGSRGLGYVHKKAGDATTFDGGVTIVSP